MAEKKLQQDLSRLVKAITNEIEEKKGENIVTINLKKIPTAVCDYFIICEGRSNTQVAAIANAIEEAVKKQLKQKPWHSEGFENAEWILIDYVNVVVHIFQPKFREFYNIEGLWADAEIKKIQSYQ